MIRYLKLTLLTGVCAAMFCSTALSQTLLRTYYKAADQKQKAELKSVLGTIIANHKKLGYSNLWKYYEKVDYVEGDTNSNGQYRVFDYYSDDAHYFNGNGDAVSGMNKEHVAPQSWWEGGTGINVGNDIIQVLPSEASANNAKGNYALGIAKTSVKQENNRVKTGKNANGDYVFEPCDEYKGDFARIYFYVATCYPDVPWKTSVTGTEVAFKKEDYPTLKPDFVNLLLQWHRQDPVCEWEITRNDRVYGEQGNRNPFVDYPQLAEYIWGDSIDYKWDLATAVPNDYTLPEDTVPGDTVIIPGDTIPTDTVPADTIPSDTIITDSTIITLAFIETFDDIDGGNSTETTGSSSAWNGNDSIPTVANGYKAGQALRLGTSKKTGSLTTIAIPAQQGDTLRVDISVKGWTTIEGDLKVSLTDTDEQTLKYTATMNNAFETVTATFENIPTANPKLTLETTSKRCFIDEIRVFNVKRIPVVTPPEEPEEPTEEEKEHQRLIELCDLDGDGRITVSDITLLIQFYLEQ
ncbi:MAG: endonuclease [Bacteroidaceae bacterium]|nr:endonuclease [Bacteroidaceae bacterium]